MKLQINIIIILDVNQRFHRFVEDWRGVVQFCPQGKAGIGWKHLRVEESTTAWMIGQTE